MSTYKRFTNASQTLHQDSKKHSWDVVCLEIRSNRPNKFTATAFIEMWLKVWNHHQTHTLQGMTHQSDGNELVSSLKYLMTRRFPLNAHTSDTTMTQSRCSWRYGKHLRSILDNKQPTKISIPTSYPTDLSNSHQFRQIPPVLLLGHKNTTKIPIIP